MTHAAVAIDGGEALHVPLELTTKVTFDDDTGIVDGLGDLRQLVVAQFTRANVGIDTGFLEDLGGATAGEKCITCLKKLLRVSLI